MYKEPNYKSTAWLAKYGWQKGQGLGKNRDGATDFLRVSVKTDNAGLGTEIPSPDEQFRGGFGWWDQVYNRAASAIKVNISEEEKVEVQMNKKTTTSKSNLEKFYGGAFVKASEETKEENEDKSDTSATSLDEKTIFETCGGRTLSKYRFRMGKTTRAAEQERQWESKGDNDTNEEAEEDTRETKEERPKSTKKRKRLDADRTNKEEANEEKEGEKKKKKKKKPKKKKSTPEDDAEEQDQAETEPIQKTAKKRKTEKKAKKKKKSKSGPKRDSSHDT